MPCSTPRRIVCPPVADDTPQLQIFSPGSRPERPTPDWSLDQFFRCWYVPERQHSLRERPISKATIAKLGDAVAWWTAAMATPDWPSGPPLRAISDSLLADFSDALARCQHARGPGGQSRPLSPSTRHGHLKSLKIVLAAAGPPWPGRIRAGILADPPSVYVEAPLTRPRATWTLDEAKRIFAAVELVSPRQPRKMADRWRLPCFVALAKATVGFWYYTGHRCGTVLELRWSQLYTETGHDGQAYSYLQIRSRKTGKPDAVIVPPHLRSLLDAVRQQAGDDDRICRWPLSWSSIVHLHRDWQVAAGLDPNRIFGPQAWRRLHSKAIQLSELQHLESARRAQESLGHFSMSTTLASYTEVSLSPKNQARLRLPRLDE